MTSAHPIVPATSVTPASPVTPVTRGNGFRFPEVEAMGSGSGTHRLRLGISEPIASGPIASGPIASPKVGR
jgi:hypothetical protein